MAGETEKLRPVNSIFIPMLLSFTPGREATGAVACQMVVFVAPPLGGATYSVRTVVGRANRLSNSRADPKVYPYETTCRRSRDPGIFIWSRYFATVRRESFWPSLARVLAISSSVNGLRASSASIIFLILN